MKAKFIKEVTVIDPDSKLPVDVSIYKEEESGGMFGVDTSFVVEVDPYSVYTPLQNHPLKVQLID
jgi:hypothetical protein